MDVERMIEFLTEIVEDMEQAMAYQLEDVPPTDNPAWVSRNGQLIAWLHGEIRELEGQLDVSPPMIETRQHLLDVQKKLGVRHDWHEPDEQEVTAEWVGGRLFDNAQMPAVDSMEMCVRLRKGERTVGVVNLASLFAMACGEDF